ncbi:hypothetical protein GCWU000341_00647 [Oribacterium sp. oral taxon 078 str. F0262]|nr:hypothetical protein GCWU000341_00647 [Oribacterium sp. oral taxon 078 str. F0262]
MPPGGRSAEATRAKPSPSLRRSEEKAQKSAIRQTRSVIDHFSKRSGVLAPYLTIGRSNTGRSRFDCRGQRRISDLQNQIAKRRGGRRPVYESVDRQGGGRQFPAESCAGDFSLWRCQSPGEKTACL